MREQLKWYDVQVTLRLNPLNWYWRPRYDVQDVWFHFDVLFLTVTVLYGG
jgi:hypothetical protein